MDTTELNLENPAVKSLTIIKQTINDDGTRGKPEIAAYMDRNPDVMQAVIDGKRLPDTVTAEDGITKPHKVTGAITYGRAVVDLLNSTDKKAARRVAAINARQAGALREARTGAANRPSRRARLWARITRSQS